MDNILRLTLSPLLDWFEPNDLATLTVVAPDARHASICEHANLIHLVSVLNRLFDCHRGHPPIRERRHFYAVYGRLVFHQAALFLVEDHFVLDDFWADLGQRTEQFWQGLCEWHNEAFWE